MNLSDIFFAAKVVFGFAVAVIYVSFLLISCLGFIDFFDDDDSRTPWFLIAGWIQVFIMMVLVVAVIRHG
jgi:hypothetical protein